MKKLIDVPEEVMKALQDEADRVGITLTALINVILSDYVRRLNMNTTKNNFPILLALNAIEEHILGADVDFYDVVRALREAVEPDKK